MQAFFQVYFGGFFPAGVAFMFAVPVDLDFVIYQQQRGAAGIDGKLIVPVNGYQQRSVDAGGKIIPHIEYGFLQQGLLPVVSFIRRFPFFKDIDHIPFGSALGVDRRLFKFLLAAGPEPFQPFDCPFEPDIVIFREDGAFEAALVFDPAG